MTAANPSSLRNDKIDLLRGWLIFLVIVGHIVLGSVHENPIRYVIYAFHMPLFIGLSGYLINAERLVQGSFLSLLVRYWRRVLLPFALAFCVFTGVLIFHAWDESRLSQKLLLSYLVTPYYHLWFVPTLVLWVLALWAVLKLKIPITICMLVSVVITLLWAVLAIPDLAPILTMIVSKKVVYFFGFFLFGVWLKTKPGQKCMRGVTSFKALPAALLILCAVIYLMNIGPEKSFVKGLAWLVMNLNLMIICIAWAAAVVKRKQKTLVNKHGQINPCLVSMGRISLPIYLWHVLPLFLLKGFDVHISMPWGYYGLSIVSVMVIVGILIKLENRSSITNRVLYGV